MKVKTIGWGVVLMVLLGSLTAFGYTVTHTFPVTFTANPTGEWSLQHGIPGWGTAGQLQPMTPSGGLDGWRDNSDGHWQPSYNYNFVTAFCTVGWAAGTNAAVAVFQAPQTGDYSVKIDWRSYGINTDETLAYLDVRTAPDLATPATVLWSGQDYFPTYTEYVFSHDLSTVPALQNIHLTAGSYILFSMAVNQAGYSGAAFRFLDPVSQTYPGGSIVANITSTVQGTVVPGDFTTGDLQQVGVRMEFRQGGNVIQTKRFLLSDTGTFSVSGIEPGTYDIAVKATCWLQTVLTGQYIAPGVTTLDPIVLIGGDNDGDNGVTSSDLSVVLSNMDATGGL